MTGAWSVRCGHAAWVVESRGWLSLTLKGRTEFERIRRRRAIGGGEAASGRAEAILRAAEALDLAIPRGAEIQVGDVPAYADDVVAGLRAYARELGRNPYGGSPPIEDSPIYDDGLG